MKRIKKVFAELSVTIVAIASLSQASQAVPVSYTRSLVPIGNGYGIANITDTEAATDSSYTTQYVGGGGVCSAFQSGSNYKVYGALFDFGTVLGANSSAEDIIGFNFTYDPTAPDTLNISRNLTAIVNPYGNNNIRDLGYGGVSHDGTLAFRMDGYSGGIAGNAVGTLNLDAPTTTVLNDYTDSTYFKLLGGGTIASDTFDVPTIGENQNMVVAASFGKFVAGFRDDIQTPSSVVRLTPHGEYLDEIGTDGRGSASINDNCQVIAACTLEGTSSDEAGSLRKGEYYKLRVIKYSDLNGVFKILSNNVYPFNNIGDGNTYVYANFFGRSAYSGPQQISINDNGDIAFPVTINPDVNFGWDTGTDNAVRYASRRGILFMSHNNPGVFKCVVDNMTVGPSVYFEKRTLELYPDFGGRFMPAFGGVALDNDCNVYFSAVNWIAHWPSNSTSSSDVKSTNAIYKATANNTDNPTYWNCDPIIWRGMCWRDENDICEISILPIGKSGQEWINVPGTFCCQDINRTKLPGKTDPKYSIGGLFISAGVGIDGKTGSTMRGMYLAPTDQLPSAASISDAKKLADNEPVNLINCIVVGSAGTYVDTSGNTYYRFRIADASSSIVISTIRPERPKNTDGSVDENIYGLGVGDKVYVSGKLSTNTTADANLAIGERYIQSGGLVLVKNALQIEKLVAMNNNCVGDGKGLSTAGMHVKAFGKVSEVNQSDQFITIDDGSGTPVKVMYGSNIIPSMSTGDYISATGYAMAGSQKAVYMASTDSIRKF